MKYTVKQLAKLSGTTVRTVHYYDEIGLLKPSYIKENGYRYYEKKEVLLLQQIMFFKELEFSLEEIKEILNSRSFDKVKALEEHKKLLKIKQDRIANLIKSVDITINNLKGNKKMNSDDLFNAFNEKEIEEYKKEAKKRWGNTEAYKQSQERTKNWTKADYSRIQKETDELTKQLANAMELGVESDEVQNLIEKHYKGIQQFYDCSYEMYKELGNLYVEDTRFSAFYNNYKPGLAEFMQKAMHYYCNTKTK